MKTVKQILAEKGSDVWTIDSDSSVYDALALMAEKNIGALIAVDKGKPVGVVSERDYARKVALLGRISKNTPVKEVMARRVICATTDRTPEECMALMTEKRVRHIPIVKNGDMIGLISIGDVVKAIIAEQKFIIEQLENFIST